MDDPVRFQVLNDEKNVDNRQHHKLDVTVASLVRHVPTRFHRIGDEVVDPPCRKLVEGGNELTASAMDVNRIRVFRQFALDDRRENGMFHD